MGLVKISVLFENCLRMTKLNKNIGQIIIFLLCTYYINHPNRSTSSFMFPILFVDIDFRLGLKVLLVSTFKLVCLRNRK